MGSFIQMQTTFLAELRWLFIWLIILLPRSKYKFVVVRAKFIIELGCDVCDILGYILYRNKELN